MGIDYEAAGDKLGELVEPLLGDNKLEWDWVKQVVDAAIKPCKHGKLDPHGMLDIKGITVCEGAGLEDKDGHSSV
jgi:hypothetical protein